MRKIYHRKDGRFEGRIAEITANGSRKYISVYGRTAEEVKAKATLCLWLEVQKERLSSARGRHENILIQQAQSWQRANRRKAGLETEGYCDSKAVLQWKMDMMGEFIFDECWQEWTSTA